VSGGFATTQWSVVLAAARSRDPGARDALDQLCRTYWPPLYVFARRKGHTPEQAEDLTQGFFARLIERGTLRGVERERGRFRSFLRACFARFIADEHDREGALKRGGRGAVVPLDAHALEAELPTALVDTITPEVLFERRWAVVVLDTALRAVHLDYAASGKERVFEALRPTLVGGSEEPYRALAEGLGMSEGALKVAVHRLRRRFTSALRAEIARTVDPADVDDEIRHLLTVLAAGE
jgi:RNA polymerase sigma-70 factor (ECF subfamily)